MAIGSPNKSTRPEVRRVFSEAPNVVRREIVPPGTYGDGQTRDGTPAGRTSTAATTRDYTDGAPYRNDLRGGTSRGLTGGLEGRGTNPTVHSKNTKRYGRDGSRLDATHKSTGDQPAPAQRDQLPPSWPPRTHTDRVPEGGVSRRVGYPGGGQPFVELTHTTTRKHGSDGHHDPRASTDGAQGLAWHASGGQHGSPSPRGPSRDRAAPPGTTAKVRTSKLDKAEYVGPNKGRGPSTR